MNQVAAEKIGAPSLLSTGPVSVGPSTDLRGWLGAADKMGELRTVEGADWNLELGAIA